MKPYYFIGGAPCHVIRGAEMLDQGHKLEEFGQVIYLSDEDAAYCIGTCHLPVLPEEAFSAAGFTPGVRIVKPGSPRHAPTLAERDPEFGKQYSAALAALNQIRASFAAPQQEI